MSCSSDHNPPAVYKRPSIILCLSGGGFRAALFHYGFLKRLKEVGLLAHVRAISATSGGSLAAAVLAMNSDQSADTPFYTYQWENFEKAIMALTKRGILRLVTVLVLVRIFYSISILLFILYLLIWQYNFLLQLYISVFLLGLILHLFVFGTLVYQKAFQLFEKERHVIFFMYGEDLPKVNAYSIRRFIDMLLFPARVRLESLNFSIFKGVFLKYLTRGVPIFLTAVNLNNGKETVFGGGTIAPFNASGCRALWENTGGADGYSGEFVEVAAAVAASTAIPPFFKPVAVFDNENLVGVFVDGGVADNLAINFLKASAAHGLLNRADVRDSEPGSQSLVSEIFIVDGSKPLQTKNRFSWPWLFSFGRVIDAMSHQHNEDVLLSGPNIGSIAKSHVRIFSLSESISYDDGFDDRIDNLLKNVRTHLDGLNDQECAALAYGGYRRIDYLLNDNYLSQFAGTTYTTPLKFEEILPECNGRWDTRADSVVKTLRFSHRRISFLRWIGRKFGL